MKKKVIIIIIIILLIGYSLLVLLLANKEKKYILNDEIIYFSIQNAVRSFLNEKENEKIYKYLDTDYIKENNITINNVNNLVYSNYSDVFFIAKKIIVREKNDMSYYFINGYTYGFDYLNNQLYVNNDNYLIKYQKSKYNIVPLKNIDIDEHESNYKLKSKSINNGVVFDITSTNEKNKLATYIAEFLNLLSIDNKRSYDMLSNNYRNQFNSYENYYNKSLDIYNNISTNIKNYNVKKINDKKIYEIIDKNDNNIKIVENSVMDYTIEFD